MAKKKRPSPDEGASPGNDPAPKKGPKAKGRQRPKSTKKKGKGGATDHSEVLERLMREAFGELMDVEDDTPSGKAEALVVEAYNEPDDDRRREIARKALAIDPDCTEAYALLADLATTRKEALALAREAVAAGERSLGPEAFGELEGHFWGVVETRPYMRARLSLAETLWTTGGREEAVEHLRTMLQLNPNDNQGVRYILASWLPMFDRDDDLAALLDRYPDDASATWAYAGALLAFRREGDTAASRKRLRAAKKVNKHVPDYLTGRLPMPSEQPESYTFGGRDEAVLYAAGALGAWRSTSGAITWVRETLKPSGSRARARPTPSRGPSAAEVKRLARLPQEFDTWQVGLRELPQWIEVGGERMRPWMVLVVSRTSGLILASAMIEQPPTADLLWDVVATALRRPSAGNPHRPTELLALPDGRWEELGPHLETLGIELVRSEALDVIDLVFADLAEHLTRDQPPALLEMPGVDAGRVGRFFAAAASFYRRAPWRSLGYEAAIQVEADRFESGPWYAVVMGQSGLTLGLALYEDFDLLRRMWAGELSDEENARETVALTVTFDGETDVPPADLDAAREHGWEVAGPEAYPSVFRKERGLSMRPPLAWELDLLEGCLVALPEFVARHSQDDPSPETIAVETASGPLRLRLSWAGEA